MLPHLNSFPKLVNYLISLALIFLGVVFINNIGVTQMLFGSNIANNFIYPIADVVIQWCMFRSKVGQGSGVNWATLTE